jgi:lysine 2,3-aminomutase
MKSKFGIVTKRNHSLWGNWKWQLQNRVQTIEDLREYIELDKDEEESLEAAKEIFDFGVSPYYASLMDPKDPNCPIRLQSIPRSGELLRFPGEVADPLAEEENMPVKAVTHRYPDRALWYLSHHCAVFCRFCTRKRKVSRSADTPSKVEWELALDYFRRTPEIREVILSGGDPFSLSESQLQYILRELKKIPSILWIRIHTRHPVTLPMRFTDELVDILSEFFPIYLVTHFNHPKECTAESASAIKKLVTKGNLQILNQTVLLKGINDSVEVLEELNYRLLGMGVKPYYLHQCDEVFGISCFQVPIKEGMKIYQGLRGRMSGISVPLYVADLKGGGGKVPLLPEYLVETKETSLIFRNYKGELYEISNGEPKF